MYRQIIFGVIVLLLGLPFGVIEAHDANLKTIDELKVTVGQSDEETYESIKVVIKNGEVAYIDPNLGELYVYAEEGLMFSNGSNTDDQGGYSCDETMYSVKSLRKPDGTEISGSFDGNIFLDVSTNDLGEYTVIIEAGCPLTISSTYENKSIKGKHFVINWLRNLFLPKKAIAHDTEAGWPVGEFHFTLADIKDKPTEPECCSSVLFLPGIMGTELFEGNDKRWEPDNEADVERLYLDETGKSINDITIGEVIGTFDGPSIFNADIYKSFLNDLENKKQEGFLKDYKAYGYDWRLSLEDILADGELENELRTLAATSKTGKVTIVAHSNGGLLAKALINKLADDSSDLVDSLVLIGVPQLGNPQAIGSLLHGFESGIPKKYPLWIKNKRARDFAQNAPFAYNLLPHSDYYTIINQPLVSFDDGEATQKFIDEYGYGITNPVELKDFLLGVEGRTTPIYDDLVNPTKANSVLLNQSNEEYSAIDSGWLPPSGIEVHQIAGVGVSTVTGIKYKTINYCEGVFSVLNGWYCASNIQTLGYSPVRVIDGDATVIEPSALVMSEDEGVKRWWVDLEEYNDRNSDIEHAGLLEISNLRSFIFDNILATSTEAHSYITDFRPELNGINHLTFTLHSPLTLSYTESDGLVVNEQNPYGAYSQFTRYGEVQIIDIFGDNQGSVVMNGESTGSFTLEIEEVAGNEIVAVTTYSAIPSSTTTVATVVVTGDSIEDIEKLTVDYDGNGETDFALEPVEGEIVTLPEQPTDSTLEDLVNDFKNYVELNVSNRSIKRSFINSIDSFYKQHQRIEEQKNRWSQFMYLFINNPVYQLRLQSLERQSDLYGRIGWIDIVTAEELKRSLDLIKNKL